MKKTYGRQKLTIDQMCSTRSAAIVIGHTYYFTSKPCKYGHVAPQIVSNGRCTKCKRMIDRLMYKFIKGTGEKVLNTYGPDKLTVNKMKVSREKALDAGHSHYFTRKPCKYGHLAPRKTQNSFCVVCKKKI